MVEGKSDQQIGYILRSYPRLSQTFILNEILALERQGVQIKIYAVTQPREQVVQPEAGQVRAPVTYLDKIRGEPAWKLIRLHAAAFLHHPIGYLRAFLHVLKSPQIDQGYVADSRWTCFLQAVYLVNLHSGTKPEDRVSHLHAHFAHDSALIAQLVHQITGLPYSFTAHARDLYQVKEGVLKQRINQAEAVMTCCQANLDYLSQIHPSAQRKFRLIHHGISLQGFDPVQIPVTGAGIPLILSTGRLVEKKGFLDLLAALKIAKRCGYRFRCEIYGEGPLEDRLRAQIIRLGLQDEIVLAGSRTQQDLLQIYQKADLFILTPIQTSDGDRDGIPNVLIEAMAAGLPVISTAVGGIPELISSPEIGLLFQPGDPAAVATGILDLIDHPEKRTRLGVAGRHKVADQFDLQQTSSQLKTLFAEMMASRQTDSPQSFFKALSISRW